MAGGVKAGAGPLSGHPASWGGGFQHLERGNYRGTRNLLIRGVAQLEPFEPRCMGVEVAVLRSAATRSLEEVERLGPDRLRDFDKRLIPRVELASE